MSAVIGGKVASAEDLFRVRKTAKKLPRAVGSKGYDPKEQPHLAELEQQYLRQRTSLLKEPRSVQDKVLYRGEWIEERNLVRVHEVGKFWTYVGFSDSDGKWLYPEEALFLMETNVLEVRMNGYSLSQQEALQLCLTRGDLTMEEYTVYCTLRRSSYLVTRFHRDPDLSFYAQSIGLDQYINRAKKPRQEKRPKSGITKADSVASTDQTAEHFKASKTQARNTSDGEFLDGGFECSSTPQQMDSSCQNFLGEVLHADQKTDVDKMDVSSSDKKGTETLHDSKPVEGARKKCRKSSSGQLKGDKKGRTVEECDRSDLPQSDKHMEQSRTVVEAVDTGKSLHTCVEGHSSQVSPSIEQSSSDLHQNSENIYSRILTAWGNCFVPEARNKPRGHSTASVMSGVDLSQVFIPDIAGKLSVALRIPKASLLPPGVELNEELRDICLYSRPEDGGNLPVPEDLSSVQSLRFSYAEWMSKRKVPAVQAQNWREYKEKMAEAERNTTVYDSPAAHLWQGETTPLVHPTEATCVDTVFDKLKIKTFDLHQWVAKRAKCDQESSVKISFSVFTPNAEFRKSRPGRPDHRVVVRKITERFPSIWERAEAARLCADGVPVHWAFLDCGSVSFFRINPITLPSMV